jgi:hypothetical protein
MGRHSLALLLWFCMSFGYTQSPKTYIPPKAFQHFPTVIEEQQSHAPHLPSIPYIGALIEHESCISLKHSRCWETTSELKSAREWGVGLGQLTIAYNKDGSTRFDTLTELKNRHKEALKDLNWNNITKSPRLQIRSIVLLTNDNYVSLSTVPDPWERLKMSDAAYNGGRGGLQKERVACGLAKNCDPNIWYGHVEVFCLKSRAVLYGKRSACDINRDHVRDVFETRLPKYEKAFEAYK